MASREYLFNQYPWPTAAANQRMALEEGIIALDGDRLLNTAIHDLSTYFAERFKFDIPVLLTDKIVVDQREAIIEVGSDRNLAYTSERARGFAATGTLVEVSVPFEGDALCFDIQPTTFTFNLPRGEAHENLLTFYIEGVDLIADQVRAQIQQMLNDVSQNLRYLRSDCDRFNANLYSYAHSLIQKRRRKLLSDRNLLTDLGFKLKERSDSPVTFQLPEIRQKIVPVLPLATKTPYRPEPYLATRDFARVLEVMQKMAQVMQHSPSALLRMDDDALPAHFLFQLNGHFEGKNPVETFAYAAKNTIGIQGDGKHIFLAECHFWTDARDFAATLRRLLGFSSWRDTKAAVLLFNRDKDFSQMLEAIQATVRGHSNLKRELPQLSKTSLPYVFAHHADRNREMLLTILAFDVQKPA
jgi:hypothetical protein